MVGVCGDIMRLRYLICFFYSTCQYIRIKAAEESVSLDASGNDGTQTWWRE